MQLPTEKQSNESADPTYIYYESDFVGNCAITLEAEQTSGTKRINGEASKHNFHTRLANLTGVSAAKEEAKLLENGVKRNVRDDKK